MATKIAKSKPEAFNVKGSWSSYDCINGVQILDKDKIRITWPNGTKEVVTAIVHHSRETVSDMGTPYDCPVSRAFMNFGYMGSKITIRFTDCSKLKGEFVKDVLKDEEWKRFREKNKS